MSSKGWMALGLAGLAIGTASSRPGAAAAMGQRPLYFSVSAMISPQETFAIYLDLAAYLSRKLGRQVLLKQRRTYQEVNNLLHYGEIDFAWVCTGGYLEAHRNFYIVALATPVIQGRPTYYAYLIVSRDSPVEEFQDLRGRTFAFTDPLSLTGKIYPTYLVTLNQTSVEEFFSGTFYTFSHDRAIEAVAEGLAAGASVDSQVYEFLLSLKPELIARTRILQVSDPFGAPPVVAGLRLQAGWRARIQAALLDMGEDQEGQAILRRLHVDRFVLPSPELYQEAQRVKEIAGSPGEGVER